MKSISAFETDLLTIAANFAGTKEIKIVAVKLNKQAFEYAKGLVREERIVLDERDQWSKHQSSLQRENAFIRLHGLEEYGKWYLGIDDERQEKTEGRYKFPDGDFIMVHRCGVIAGEARAGQYRYLDIENAGAHLHGRLELMRNRRVMPAGKGVI